MNRIQNETVDSLLLDEGLRKKGTSYRHCLALVFSAHGGCIAGVLNGLAAEWIIQAAKQLHAQGGLHHKGPVAPLRSISHDTNHLFSCPARPTTRTVMDRSGRLSASKLINNDAGNQRGATTT